MTEFIPKLSPAAPIAIEPIEGFLLADGWNLSNAVTSLSAGYPQTAWTTDRNAPPCIYDPLIRAEGLVRISAQIFPDPLSHGGWIFRVHHAGVTEELAVPLPEGSESVIAALGEFTFTGDGTERVEILPANPGAMTRIGTLIFDIVNDRGANSAAASTSRAATSWCSPIPTARSCIICWSQAVHRAWTRRILRRKHR